MQPGKVVFTASQFVWWLALNETPGKGTQNNNGKDWLPYLHEGKPEDLPVVNQKKLLKILSLKYTGKSPC